MRGHVLKEPNDHVKDYIEKLTKIFATSSLFFVGWVEVTKPNTTNRAKPNRQLFVPLLYL